MPQDMVMGVEAWAIALSSPSLVVETPGEEGPSYFHNELRVSGWAVGAEQVTVELAPLDGEVNTGARVVNVGEHLQRSVEAPAGRFDLRLGTAECSRGTHSLTISAIHRDGAELEARRVITIEPYDEAIEPSDAAIERSDVVICCEVPGLAHPDEIGPRVFIRGWCYASGGIERVLAFLDGRYRYDALFPVPRQDVEHALGRPDALLSGFALPLDADACPPGEHALTLLVAGTSGRVAGRSLSFRCRAASAEQGTLEDGTLEKAGDGDPRDPAVMIDPSLDRSELLGRCEFESLRATVAERHAFVSLTESNTVAEAYRALRRAKLMVQQELDAARRAREEAERRAAEAERRAVAAEHWLEEHRRSLSWRVTEPLRAAKHAARRIRG